MLVYIPHQWMPIKVIKQTPLEPSEVEEPVIFEEPTIVVEETPSDEPVPKEVRRKREDIER